VRTSTTKEQAAVRVSEIRGVPTTWNALDLAARRILGEKNLHSLLGTKADAAWKQSDRFAGYAAMTGPLKPQGMDDQRALRMERERAKGRKHLIIPDTQCKRGVPLEHLLWIGKYIADKQPDVVVHLGDHWDMPSLSSYDSAAKKAKHGTLVVTDIDAGNEGLELLHEGMQGYEPQEKYLLEGNHDGFAPQGRIGRYNADYPHHEGLITPEDFNDGLLGWKRIPFLQSIDVDGIRYSHLHPFTLKGTVTLGAQRRGASSAAAQLKALMQSCTAGHKQGLETYMHHTPSRTLRSVIAGSCYLHDEEYMEPGNRHWRGILMKHDVSPDNPNHYDLMEVSLDFLKRRFG
jgi:hypothetical protein